MSEFSNIKILANWRKEIYSNKFKFNLLYCFFLGVMIIYVYPQIMYTVENRDGIVLNDWILEILPPHDFSIPLFVLVHSAIWFTLFYYISNPKVFIKIVQVWGTVQVIRMITIYLVPLEAPTGMIPLIDPFVDFIIGNDELIITNDLFFSGHTSTSFLAVLFLDKKVLRIIASVMCAAIGVLIMWQHVHYAIDVFAAPFFAYVTYWGVYKFDSVIFPKPEKHKNPLP